MLRMDDLCQGSFHQKESTSDTYLRLDLREMQICANPGFEWDDSPPAGPRTTNFQCHFQAVS